MVLSYISFMTVQPCESHRPLSLHNGARLGHCLNNIQKKKTLGENNKLLEVYTLRVLFKPHHDIYVCDNEKICHELPIFLYYVLLTILYYVFILSTISPCHFKW